MKNSMIIAAFFLLCANIVSAQEDPIDNRNKFQIGAKAGVSYANVYDTDGEAFDADARFGFTGGAFFAIPIGKYLGIQPEVLVTQKGFKGSGSLLGSSYSFKRTTTFLEIPLLVAFKPIEYVTIFLGPQYSFLLKQRDVFTSSIISYDQEQVFKQDNIRKNILGVVAGADINIKQFVISGRVGWDIMKNKGDGTSSTPRYKNVCVQLGIGYKIIFGNSN